MRKMALTLLVAAMGIGFISCSEEFFTNTFKAAGLGQYDAAAANLSTSADITAGASSSPTFYQQLTTAQISTAIDTLFQGVPNYSAGTQPTVADLSQALQDGTVTAADLALAATIQIKTTEAAAVIDNLPNAFAVLTAPADPNAPPQTDEEKTAAMTTALVSAIIPANALPDMAMLDPQSEPNDAFVKIMDSFANAAASFQAISDNLQTGESLPTLPVTGGSSADTASYALISLAVASIEPAAGWVNPNPSVDTKTAVLWAAINGDTTAIGGSNMVDSTGGLSPTISNLMSSVSPDLQSMMSSGNR
ncbi:MAG: hypothetical protein ACOYM2_16975 [Rectinemataceae bacterium]